MSTATISTPAAALNPTLLAGTVAPPALAGDAAVRAALERAYRLPSYTPPPGPAGVGANLLRAGGFVAAFLAGRYLTSEGELNLAKDTGQIPGYVSQRDMQDASVAFSGANFDGTRAQSFSADQKGRLIVGSAELQRLHADGRISEAERTRGVNELFQNLASGQTSSSQPQRQPEVYGPSLQELERGAQQQRQNNNSAQWSPAPSPNEVLPVTPGSPSRIGGVSAERVRYSDANLQQAISDARAFNAANPTQAALGYAIKDSQDGQWYVERIVGITPSSARTLVYNLNQRGQLAHPTEEVFRSSGIGGWRDGNGRVAGAERDLQLRENNAYFASLTPAQWTAAAQAGALTINGQRGSVYGLDAAAALRTQIVGDGTRPGLNAADRGNVSLAIQRNYTIPGPNGSSQSVRGVEVFANLSPAEARSVLNAAANDGSLYAPPGTRDTIDWNLAQNGLSRDGLIQRERRLSDPPRPQPSQPEPDPQRPPFREPDPATPPPFALPSIPEPTVLPGGDDVARVSREYGVAQADVRAVMEANPGMSAEQAAQYLKGSLLASPTGGNQAQVPPTPPRNNNAGAPALPGAPDPGNGQTINLMQPSDLGMPTTTGADGATVINFEFTGPTADLDRAKWEASGYRIHDSKAPGANWNTYISDRNGQVVGFIPNARLANPVDRFWQTVQHNAQQIADPAKREAYISRWRNAINVVLNPTANRLPPSDLANQVRRWNEIDQAERSRQNREGAGEEIILPPNDPRLPENRIPPWQRPAP
jgi:hypothetical protein